MELQSVLEAEKQARTTQSDNRWLLSTRLLQTVETLESYVQFAKHDKSTIDNIQLPGYVVQLNKNLYGLFNMKYLWPLLYYETENDPGFSHYYIISILKLEKKNFDDNGPKLSNNIWK